MYQLAELQQIRREWQSQGLSCVLTNGVFDLLHIGHVRYLQEARALGDRLIVALNSDASTQALKGPRRPLVPEHERAALLEALRCVDAVTVFGELTAETVVDSLRPDIYVKGGDYARDIWLEPDLDRLPEARVVRTYGGTVRLLPYTAGRSTSELIAKIKDAS